MPEIVERPPAAALHRAAESASPATGSRRAHKIEQRMLIDEVFAPLPGKSARTSTRPRAQN
jgi:hypothetical protein